MQAVTFTDPKTAATYTWPHNPGPTGLQAAGMQRQIERTSNTGNVGSVKQQGDDGPFILHWEPIVNTTAFEQKLWEWYELSKLQSIRVTDWNGEVFEGQIIMLTRQQILPGGFYQYVFEFEVWKFVSGLLHTAGVTP